jgi:hypothetical protein
MNMRALATVSALIVATALSWTDGALAQPSPQSPANITPTKMYLMAFHTCEGAACTDPRNHRVQLAESDDGGNWSLVPGWSAVQGSVPDVIRRDDTLYVYTASPLVSRYDIRRGLLDRPLVTVTGLPSGSTSDWVDPSLIVDDQNRLVLFMLYAPFGGGDPAGCTSGVLSCVKQFLSATEVEGSNGTQFVVDPGQRATVTVGSATPLGSASDPDIFFDGSQFVMYLSHGGSVSVWTSPELRGTYTLSTSLPNGLLSNQKGGVPAGHYDTPTQHYWTYAHTQESRRSIIRRAGHPNLAQPIADASWATVLSGEAIGLPATTSVESPSFTTREVASGVSPLCSALTVPSPISATVVGSTIDLVWGGVGGSSAYLVEVGTASGASDVAATDTGSDNTTASMRVVHAGTYYVRIRARNACATSAASVEQRVTVTKGGG